MRINTFHSNEEVYLKITDSVIVSQVKCKVCQLDFQRGVNISMDLSCCIDLQLLVTSRVVQPHLGVLNASVVRYDCHYNSEV